MNKIAKWSGMECINGTDRECKPVGDFTCFSQIGSPTIVDLAWCSTDHKSSILKLQVLDFMPDISDHCPISLVIEGNYRNWEDKRTPASTRETEGNQTEMRMNRKASWLA